MKHLSILLIPLFLVQIGCISHKPMADKSIDDKIVNQLINIEELITLNRSNKKQQKILIQFRNNCQADDSILVKEFINYYDIIVEHPSANGFTGGAEGYKVDKKTGKSEMIWHEHPMELPEEEIPN